MQGFAGPQVEARVMPRTAHRVVDNEPFDEGTAVVGAKGADREYFGSPARQQHRLFADMADELAAICEFGDRNSPRQIGADRLCLIFGHSSLLRLSFAVRAFSSTSLVPPKARSQISTSKRPTHGELSQIFGRPRGRAKHAPAGGFDKTALDHRVMMALREPSNEGLA